jgi:hypothetical protein
MILVFRYGEPDIEEPLALAYDRALSKLGSTEKMSLIVLRGTLEREPPAGDVKSKISTWVRQVPEWLRYFCLANVSMRLLGLEDPPLSERCSKFRHATSDGSAWPLLPQGLLEPRRDYGEQYRFVDEMSSEDLHSYLEIREKPEHEWTRHEHRFIREIQDREPTRHVVDKRD